jgi:LDH2 family malate/lactate/ureidoglycolate dehydrogenase
MFGTNPIAFAAPANREGAFVLDMSTTVVTRGKVELFRRLGKELPQGWAVDRHGRPAKDAGALLDDMARRNEGGILPLGGADEINGGHKGYGLAVMVDILSSVLSGGAFLEAVHDTETSAARVNHFFGAVKIDIFRDPEAFKEDMDKMLASLRNCPLAEGAERVYFAGQKELENEKNASICGVPLLKKVYSELCVIGKQLDVSPLVCENETNGEFFVPKREGR